MTNMYMVHDPLDGKEGSLLGPYELKQALTIAKNRAHSMKRCQSLFKLTESHYVKPPAEPEVVEVRQ